ncbi:MAG: glycosyltransferase family 2 protein [Pseudomonadota bacterium]
MDLAIVIPVLNEADNIAPLLAEIDATLAAEGGYEMIVVDDGSTDATAAVLDDCSGRYPQLQVIRHAGRRGQSAAIVSGVLAARASLIATLDGDGQNDPADIKRLYDTLRQAAATVWLANGYRRQRRDSWLRRLSSRVANAVRGFVLGDHTPDTGCGLKVFRRDRFLGLPRFDHMHRFLPALLQAQGGEVVSIEVKHRERSRGQSKYGVHNRLWVGLVDLFGVLWLRRRAIRPVIEKEEE